MDQSVENINTVVGGWYKTFLSDLVATGQQMGYRGAELDDLLHQFFLDLIEKKINFSEVINPRSYLQTAFRRRLIDYYRSRKSHSRHYSMYVMQDNYQSSPQEQMEKIQSNSKLIARLREMCSKLPPPAVK